MTPMKTKLTHDGQIRIPAEIRATDHLGVGDLFDLERLLPGHYVLTKLGPERSRFSVLTAEDGLPVIQSDGGVITSQLVSDLECRTS